MTVDKLVPFVRLSLMILAGYLSRSGYLDDTVVDEIVHNQMLLEAIAGGIIAVPTAAWYLWSKSRKALIEAVS